nr:IS256 family transposase [Pseudoxanthomonas sacheonensis]
MESELLNLVSSDSGLLKELAAKILEAANGRQSELSDQGLAQTNRLLPPPTTLASRENVGRGNSLNSKFSKRMAQATGLDNKIMAMYARGLNPREIQDQLQEAYNVQASAALISSITDAAFDEIKAWQARPLDPVYPIVYMDCIHVRVRDGASRVKAVYVAIGITLTGQKEALGLWISQNEGAKFWLQILTELKNRGVHEIYIACIDGLRGFPEAIATAFPKTSIQLCIVHMVRNSLDFVSWKRRREVATDLKKIYTATTAEAAEQRLADFERKWEPHYPSIGQAWRRNWPQVVTFFDFPKEIRKIIYTTNTIESINMSLRRVMKYRGSFQSDEALLKLLYLALRNISKRWSLPVHDWKAALNRFTIQFDEGAGRSI